MSRARIFRIFVCVGSVSLLYALFTIHSKKLNHEILVTERQILSNLPTPSITSSLEPIPSTPSSLVSQSINKPVQKEYNKSEDFPQFFIPRSTVVNPMNFIELTKSDTVVCDHKNPPFLTALILTIPSHYEYRQAVRNTWGSVTPKIVFIAGKSKDESENLELKTEAEMTRDIVIFNIQESYFNLTYKVLMGFRWVKEHCNGTKFVMKVDEDSFVDIESIINKLKTADWSRKIGGLYFEIARTNRRGKYGVSLSAYPIQVYPPHVKGVMYFMPSPIAFKLLNVSYYIPYCNMEDAYITGILARAVGGIQYTNILGTYYNPSGPVKGCDFITSHKLVSQSFQRTDFKITWDLLKDSSKCHVNRQ